MIRSLIVTVAAILSSAIMARTPDLLAVHQKIVADYAEVQHLEAQQLLAMPKHSRVIFDIRKPDEFTVSHIAGAIQVNPDTPSEDFMAQFGHLLKGKQTIFYCSVGRRSSKLAQNLAPTMKANGLQPPMNLVGGVFQWSNEHHPLVDQNTTPTKAVHPYNRSWSRFIKDTTSISYHP